MPLPVIVVDVDHRRLEPVSLCAQRQDHVGDLLGLKTDSIGAREIHGVDHVNDHEAHPAWRAGLDPRGVLVLGHGVILACAVSLMRRAASAAPFTPRILKPTPRKASYWVQKVVTVSRKPGAKSSLVLIVA